jgi:GNAT superfamily N-acetyltransferase
MGILNLDIAMIRPDMADIPQHPLPEGFSIRNYRPGDEEAWVAIHELADQYNRITRLTFEAEFGWDLPSFADRGFFLDAPDGRTIGTASAWYDSNFLGELAGRVHWVAIVPEYQARGLSKPLLSAVMNRLAESHDRVFLTTSSARIAAMRLYLDFGFRPLIRSPQCESGWAEVRKWIAHPLLEES